MNSHSETKIPLRWFVNELMSDLLPLAVSRRSFIVNDIDRQLDLTVDEKMLAYVLWSLLNRIVSSTENECIHIESVLSGDCMMIRVRNTGTYSYCNTSRGFRQVQYVAEKLGGNILIDQTPNHSTTVVSLILHNGIKAA
jgi:hypothetical protein